MTDVIQIAQERRAQLRAELQKLDDFIRMAEMLTRDGAMSGDVASIAERAGEAGDKGNGSAALRTNLFRQSGSNS